MHKMLDYEETVIYNRWIIPSRYLSKFYHYVSLKQSRIRNVGEHQISYDKYNEMNEIYNN